MNTPHPQYDPDLALPVGFTLRDLEFNREGKLTGKQKKLIGQNTPFSLSLAVFLALPVFLIWLFMLSIALTTPDPIDEYVAEGIFAMMFILALVYASMIAYRQRSTSQGPVMSITGTISRSIIQPSRSPYRGLHIYVKDKDFPVSDKIHDAFEEDANYTIYYDPRSKRILSVEPVDYYPQEDQIDRKAPANSSPQIDLDLMRALNFTVEDLEANQQQRLTSRQQHSFADTVNAAQLKSVSGTVFKRSTRPGTDSFIGFHIYIRNLDFRVSKAVYDTFEENAEYVVFYVRHSNIILSAGRLEPVI